MALNRVDSAYVPAPFSCVRSSDIVLFPGHLVEPLRAQPSAGKDNSTDRRSFRYLVTQQLSSPSGAIRPLPTGFALGGSPLGLVYLNRLVCHVYANDKGYALVAP